MTSTILILAICTVGLTFLGGRLYSRVWLHVRGTELTPTGFGAFLALALLAACVIHGAQVSVVVALAIVTLATAVYWLDDVRELSARFRIAVSFATGVGICAALLTDITDWPLWRLAFVCLAAGVVNVILANIINFYDGADLNLGTVIALTAGVILMSSPSGDVMWTSGIACLAFIIPFGVMNSRPRTIYLGDSGSFAFASFVTMLVIIHLRGGGEVDARAAIPLALPSFDTFFVFCVRIVQKHDLLSRNYLHLYQKLNRRYRGFGYLAPQVGNVLLCLVTVHLVHKTNLPTMAAVLIAMVLVTVPFYFVCRTIFLPGDKVGEGAA